MAATSPKDKKKREGGQILDIAARLGLLQSSVFSEDSTNTNCTAEATESAGDELF